MCVMLLIEHDLEFISFTVGCTGSSIKVYSCQNATLLEITGHGLIISTLFSSGNKMSFDSSSTTDTKTTQGAVGHRGSFPELFGSRSEVMSQTVFFFFKVKFIFLAHLELLL